MPLASRRGTRDSAEIRILPIVVWQAKLGRVCDVEGLSTELQVPTLRESKDLGNGEVDIARGGTVVGLETKVALGQRSRWKEIRDIEPLPGSPSARRIR